MEPIQLNRANLRAIRPPVRLPTYDPASVQGGIVHLGVGGFHRAHMARYTHSLMEQEPSALTWGIVGAGLLPADQRVYDSLAPQDALYTLVERSGDTEFVSVIGSITSIIYAGDSSASLLAAIDRPEIRIVSLTVT